MDEMPESPPGAQSLLSWMFSALGIGYGILLPLAGLVCFLLVLVVVLRGRGPLAAAALILIVHVPLLIGLFAAFQGAIASFTVIATSASTPKPSELAAGISTALFAPLVGVLFMVPAYATAALGALVRSLGPESKPIDLS